MTKGLGPTEETIKYMAYITYPSLEKKRCTQPAPELEIECPYAKIVSERVAKRAHEGMKKYGVTMERTDVTTVGWIDHAIEEALDLAVYLTRLKDDMQKLAGK